MAITGTDTAVGKTAIGAALARLFRERGMRVGVLKPVETGCEGDELWPRDGLMLAEAAGLEIGTGAEAGGPGLSLADVVPWRFAAALAPEAAARAAGVEIGVDRIYQAMDRWTGRCDLILVETAGGILVPINRQWTFADLLLL